MLCTGHTFLQMPHLVHNSSFDIGLAIMLLWNNFLKNLGAFETVTGSLYFTTFKVPISSISSIPLKNPRSSAYLVVKTSSGSNPIIFWQIISVATASVPAMIKPVFFGVPAEGPSPSNPMIPSTIFNPGLHYSYLSSRS